MVGMSLGLMVVLAGFSAFAWIQRSQLMLQTQAETQWRLHTAMQLLRERVQRAGAPELALDTQAMAVLRRMADMQSVLELPP
jgi:type II secretory pathway component PulJ